jgi:hypothetical protein
MERHYSTEVVTSETSDTLCLGGERVDVIFDTINFIVKIIITVQTKLAGTCEI